MANPMIPMDDSDRLIDEVARAVATHIPLRIRGGDTKAFLGRETPAEAVELDIRSHSGIVQYEPTELVITARAGTPVAELSAALDAAGQMLPCEPPEFDGNATLGGMHPDFGASSEPAVQVDDSGLLPYSISRLTVNLSTYI